MADYDYFVELTEKEVLDGIAWAACRKLRLNGEHSVRTTVSYDPHRGVTGATCKIVTLAPGTSGIPKTYVLEDPATELPTSDT